MVGVVLSPLTGDGSCAHHSYAFMLHSEADPRLSSVFTPASWTSSTVLNNAVLCLEGQPGEHVITVTLHLLSSYPGQAPDSSVLRVEAGWRLRAFAAALKPTSLTLLFSDEILASRTVSFHMRPNTPPPLYSGPVLALVDYEQHLSASPSPPLPLRRQIQPPLPAPPAQVMHLPLSSLPVLLRRQLLATPRLHVFPP